jgi:hypothetical protein
MGVKERSYGHSVWKCEIFYDGRCSENAKKHRTQQQRVFLIQFQSWSYGAVHAGDVMHNASRKYRVSGFNVTVHN